MAKSLTHYNVFLASPSDVSEERNLIEASINELNHTVCKTLHIHLDLLKWETHSYPSAGTYSQGIINEQISDYDFFIGIMWSKIGTSTINSKSGTIEEFNIAYEKFKSGKDIRILFYFSNKPIPPSEIDPMQMQEVKNFKKLLQEKGVYYYPYSLPEEFQSLVKLHISQHLNEINSLKRNELYLNEIPANADDITLESNFSEFEDLGFLEYMDVFKESFADAESSMERLGIFLSELGSNISKRTEKIDSYNEMPFSTTREIKKEIDKASNDMLDYIKRTNVEIPIFHMNYYKGMEALSNALTIQEEDGMISITDLNELLDTLNNNNEIFNSTILKIQGFKTNVSKLPRISASITLAKRKMDKTLDELLSELKSTHNLTVEFSKRIELIVNSKI